MVDDAKFLMTSCCCRGADFRDFLGFNTFFTFSLSNHFIRWLRMPILPLVVTMIGLSNLIKRPLLDKTTKLLK